MSRSLASIVFGALVLSGCGFHSGPLVAGGVGGGVIGAGTGAIIGTVIANGDVAASALVGGAVGIPIGLAIGALYDYNSEQSVRERKLEVIENNRKEIFARQREIDAARERIRTEGPAGNPADELRQRHYDGPTLGNYYR